MKQTQLYIKKMIKLNLGRLLSLVRPDIVKKIEAGGMDAYNSHYRNVPLSERLVLAAVIARYRGAQGEEILARSHKSFWRSGKAVEVHNSLGQRFETAFLGLHYPMVEALERVLAGGKYHTLCEIGCGSGQVISYMAERRRVNEFVGLDLSAEQIARNERNNKNPQLRFVAGDALEWIREHAGGGTAFFTYGGVLEYFRERELREMLRELATKPPVCFALVEPLAPDHDLEQESNSRLFGGEMSNSHNYLHAFADAGFTIVWQERTVRGPWMMLVASIDGERPVTG